MKPDPDDQYTCKRCKAAVMLHDGMEPTDYCDACAQDLVIELQSLLTAEKEASGRMRNDAFEEAAKLCDLMAGEGMNDGKTFHWIADHIRELKATPTLEDNRKRLSDCCTPEIIKHYESQTEI